MHYMMNDVDGPQKHEVIWMIEKVRRAVHILYISHKKMSPDDLEGSIDKIFDYIAEFMRGTIGSSPVKRTAFDELRRVVKRAAAKR